VRLTDLWSRLEQSFGAGYAASFAADHVLKELGGRTINQVWRAVVAAYPDRVPAKLH
jgi:hypothetical protein